MKNQKYQAILFGSIAKKKLTQQQVADAFPDSVTQQAVHRWEVDEDQPGKGRLLVLANLFEVEPYRLLDRKARGYYQGVLEHIEDLLIEADSVKDNLAIMRVSRELLRWENFFANGNFDDTDESDLDGLVRSKQINLELDTFWELMNPKESATPP